MIDYSFRSIINITYYWVCDVRYEVTFQALIINSALALPQKSNLSLCWLIQSSLLSSSLVWLLFDIFKATTVVFDCGISKQKHACKKSQLTAKSLMSPYLMSRFTHHAHSLRVPEQMHLQKFLCRLICLLAILTTHFPTWFLPRIIHMCIKTLKN